MKFTIGGLEVFFNRLEFSNDSGHILQLSVKCSGNEYELEVFDGIVSALKKNNIGVMERKKTDTDGFSEIRVLQGLEIPAVLSIMANGISVVQTD